MLSVARGMAQLGGDHGGANRGPDAQQRHPNEGGRVLRAPVILRKEMPCKHARRSTEE